MGGAHLGIVHVLHTSFSCFFVSCVSFALFLSLRYLSTPQHWMSFDMQEEEEKAVSSSERHDVHCLLPLL